MFPAPIPAYPVHDHHYLQKWYIFYKDGPTLTCHDHLKSKVTHYSSLLALCILWAGQMYSDINPSLKCHIEYFHCSKNPLCSA